MTENNLGIIIEKSLDWLQSLVFVSLLSSSEQAKISIADSKSSFFI